MKKTKHPGLRAKTYRTKAGRVLTYYVYDMRGTGKKDVRLGTDYTEALEQWRKLHLDIPLTIGRVQQACDKWRDYILKPNAPLFEKSKTCIQGGGVYALFSKDDELLYIGKTVSFNRRLNAHFWANRIPYKFFSAMDMPVDLIADMEFAHIYALRPPCNILFERWAHAEKTCMISAVRDAWGVTAEDIEK